MTLSIKELSTANEMVRELLEQLELDAYLFEVEPANDHWQVRVECPVAEGWQTVTLHVDKTRLSDCRRDVAVREALLWKWRTALAACTPSPPSSST
ncbi:hypothetical protein [Thiohalobacter thiocyanaticus]|uniref:Uncharacterized protein n=1 Tax=Thiohalobacter thiocyanaticus TaxID=585455 RepID=A0A426QGY2_9GAMM|nr:hypothetical protein [Thiohalobacter thiocyanaticus]RRQ20990.1 hypothetical protein D6C00_02730 [Thiohalobacter thiocyanaticus]